MFFYSLWLIGEEEKYAISILRGRKMKKAITILMLCLVNVALGDVFVKTLPLTGSTAFGPNFTIFTHSGLVEGGTTGSINTSENIVHHNAAIYAYSEPLVGGYGWAEVGLDVSDSINSDTFTVGQNGTYKLVLQVNVNGSVTEGQLPGTFIPGVGRTVGWLEIGCIFGGGNPESVDRLHDFANGFWYVAESVVLAELKNVVLPYCFGGLGSGASKLITIMETAESRRTWNNETVYLYSYKYLSADTPYNWVFYVHSKQASTQLGGSVGTAWYDLDATILSADLYYTGTLHTISASAGSHGSISPSGDVSVVDDGTATFYASPDSGYVVDHWSVDGIDTSNTATYLTVSNVHVNKVVQVIFKAENRAPALSNPRVTPTSGTTSTNFEVLVDYYDPDGDPPAPEYKHLILSGGLEYDMTLKSGTNSNGTYHCTVTLPSGSYSYCFFFADNKYASTQTSWRSGPYVHQSGNCSINIEILGKYVNEDLTLQYSLSGLQGPWNSIPISGRYLTLIVPIGNTVWFMASTNNSNYACSGWDIYERGNHIGGLSNSWSYTPNYDSLTLDVLYTYAPQDYTINGTVLKNDTSLVPGGVTVTLTSPEQTLSQNTTNGNWSFTGVKGGVSVTITPTASGGYEFSPPQLVFNNLDQSWTGQAITAYSSDIYVPTTLFLTVPPVVSEMSSVSFTWTGSDNVTLPANLQYQYKLDGVDADWSTWSTGTTKSYDVNNGAYTFWVRAKDETGNINQSPVIYKFVVNAAPKVIAAERINNSVWASRITLQMPLSPTHPTQTFILLPEHSGMSDTELVPVTIHSPDSNSAIGANENISAQLGVSTRIVKVGTGWLITLPQSIPVGQTAQYDIIWGKVKYFGWQEFVSIPKNFPNVGQKDAPWSSDSGGIDWQYLDEEYRLWRIAWRRRPYSSHGWDTARWMLMNVTDSSGSQVLPETALRYSRGRPYTPGNPGTMTEYSMGNVFKTGSNTCLLWLDDKHDYDGTTQTDSSRYGTQVFNNSLSMVNNYDSDYVTQYIHTISHEAINDSTWLVAKRNGVPRDAWFMALNSDGNPVVPKTMLLPAANGSCSFRQPCRIGPNILFMWTRNYDGGGYERQVIEYQIRNQSGGLVKDTTALIPVLPDGDPRADIYDTSWIKADNTGKVWISGGRFLTGVGSTTYYIILDSQGNIYKSPIQTTNPGRTFSFCDRDGYIWATEGSQFLVLNPDDTQAFAPRQSAYIPNQNVGQIAASVGSDGYRLYDRWSLQPVQIDVPSCANRNTMELFDLNLWSNALHPANLNLKKGDTSVWSQSGQFTGHTTVNMSGVLNEGQNLLTIIQDDFLGGQVLATFPYVLSIAGDVTGNGKVDYTDLKLLAEQWLNPPGIPSADIAPQPNGDGIVNFRDFAVLVENWLFQSN